MRVSHLKKKAAARLAWCLGLLVVAPLIARAEQMLIEIYTTADGLARDQINRIVRDLHGFLWF